MHDLKDLPKFSDGLSYLYVEHCNIEQQDKSIAIFDQYGITPVPCAALALLMIGPGTSITHAAMKSLSDNGCLVIWAGDEGVRFYAVGFAETRSAKNIIRQAQLTSIPAFRTLVAKKMYSMRFHENLDPNTTIQQLRGKEGNRMKTIYDREGKRTGVTWKGRQYNRANWEQSDPINRAISAANACLYGLSHSAIVSMGYSPSLGFIHIGKILSFVYDIADLYKAEYVLPLCFDIVKESNSQIDQRIRYACRDIFKEKKLLKQIAEDLPQVLDIEGYLDQDGKKIYHNSDLTELDFVSDGSIPGYLWDPQQGVVAGGVNFNERKTTNSSDPSDDSSQSSSFSSSTANSKGD
jgi:CRISPR-associated protein Cas1